MVSPTILLTQTQENYQSLQGKNTSQKSCRLHFPPRPPPAEIVMAGRRRDGLADPCGPGAQAAADAFRVHTLRGAPLVAGRVTNVPGGPDTLCPTCPTDPARVRRAVLKVQPTACEMANRAFFLQSCVRSVVCFRTLSYESKPHFLTVAESDPSFKRNTTTHRNTYTHNMHIYIYLSNINIKYHTHITHT